MLKPNIDTNDLYSLELQLYVDLLATLEGLFRAKHFGFHLMKANKQWVLLIQIGVEPLILGAYEVSLALSILDLGLLQNVRSFLR
jgi:hypothetical protein